VNIAFASMGEGPPLISLRTPGTSHVQRDWAMYPGAFQSLTRTFRLILYDARGTGLSDRDERVLMGIDDQRFITTAGEYMRACIEPEAYRAFIAAQKSHDVSALLADVEAETLVLHNNSNRIFPVRVGQKLAAGIPDARFLAIDDMSYERLAPLVEEFVGTAEKPDSIERGIFRTILFTDMEGSTSLTQRLGDAAAQDVLRTHNTIVRDALTAHSGSETKHTGDGIMASFTSASAALEAAVAIQKALADHNEGHPDTTIRVRIGLNAGEPVAEDEDLFGTAVQLAARVCDRAEAGQILVADVIQQLAAGKGFDFADQGEVSLKGFEKPVRLHEVRWHD